MLLKQFLGALSVMEAAWDEVLAFLDFPEEHWCNVWSTNPLERLNKEIKRRTNKGTFPNSAGLMQVERYLRGIDLTWLIML
ncbi:transposase [Cyanobium sp. Morenito 9A2]|uniref:transposase n=1 Tax=Cyanobium sp. Morenito 9A2 TaxID=2823718 RepID=UPI0029EA871C|nr:transposase [Cyanobium sp. Morenito 9A2]